MSRVKYRIAVVLAALMAMMTVGFGAAAVAAQAAEPDLYEQLRQQRDTQIKKCKKRVGKADKRVRKNKKQARKANKRVRKISRRVRIVGRQVRVTAAFYCRYRS